MVPLTGSCKATRHVLSLVNCGIFLGCELKWFLDFFSQFNSIIIDYEAGRFEACAIFHAELAVARVCSTAGCPAHLLLSHFVATFVTLKLQGCDTSPNQL